MSASVGPTSLKVMTHPSDLSQEDLDRLLAWLSPDRDTAGEEFLRLRSGLTRFFTAKGCSDADTLSDEALNRVAHKLKDVTPATDRPIAYVLGFAKNVFLEYLKKVKKEPVQFEGEFVDRQESSIPDHEREALLRCLDKCLAKLPAEDVAVMLEYFGAERKDRIRVRREIASRLNITAGNLHIRVFRSKAAIRKCVLACVENRKP